MARLFCAIDFPGPVREELANICYGLPRARWTPMNQMHLTLRFIGEADNTTFHRICDALDEIDCPAFTVSIKGVGHFPPRRNPSVIWAGVEADSCLTSLHDRIERALRGIDLEAEARRFHPHITLARFRDGITMEEAIPFLSANALLSIRDIPIEEFSLYSSVLTRDGAIHHCEQSYQLLSP